MWNGTFTTIEVANPNGFSVKTFLYIIYLHKEKRIQCRYESPREEAREEHD
jgi:hypothetical protein